MAADIGYNGADSNGDDTQGDAAKRRRHHRRVVYRPQYNFGTIVNVCVSIIGVAVVIAAVKIDNAVALNELQEHQRRILVLESGYLAVQTATTEAASDIEDHGSRIAGLELRTDLMKETIDRRSGSFDEIFRRLEAVEDWIANYLGIRRG